MHWQIKRGSWSSGGALSTICSGKSQEIFLQKNGQDNFVVVFACWICLWKPTEAHFLGGLLDTELCGMELYKRHFKANIVDGLFPSLDLRLQRSNIRHSNTMLISSSWRRVGLNFPWHGRWEEALYRKLLSFWGFSPWWKAPKKKRKELHNTY